MRSSTYDNGGKKSFEILDNYINNHAELLPMTNIDLEVEACYDDYSEFEFIGKGKVMSFSIRKHI